MKFAQFAKDVKGSMTIFIALTFTMMVAMAGVAIDVARFEASRSEIQTHLDNATLAAASLRQTEDPSVVVDKYMVAAGLDVKYDIKIVKEVANLTYRHVEAKAEIALGTYFMKLFGVDELGLSVTSTAQERVPLLEVSLVLDISGSMDGARLDNLIPAAQGFVTTLLNANDDDNPNRVSISLIPYNMQVNAGEALYKEAFGTTTEHDNSYCAEWEYSAFSERGFSAGKMDQHVHMGYSNYNEGWDRRDREYDLYYGHLDEPYCREETFAQILPHSFDETALHDQIEALRARGNTSIDIGVKWGLALLDPSSRDEITELTKLWVTDPETGELVTDETTGLIIPTNRQAVDPGFQGRPVDYTDEVTQKVLVVMTDGENTTEYRVKNNYRGNSNSGVYQNPLDHSEVRFSYRSGWTNLSWSEMWGNVSNYAYNRNKGGQWYTYWDSNLDNSAKNTRLSNVCDEAKIMDNEQTENPVAVFAIAYSATTNGQTALKDCASVGAYYFEAGTDDIDDVFDEIGGVIEKLKLVQ